LSLFEVKNNSRSGYGDHKNGIAIPCSRNRRYLPQSLISATMVLDSPSNTEKQATHNSSAQSIRTNLFLGNLSLRSILLLYFEIQVRRVTMRHLIAGSKKKGDS